MLREKLQEYNIILASGSPRRQQFFKELGLDFEIFILDGHIYEIFAKNTALVHQSQKPESQRLKSVFPSCSETLQSRFFCSCFSSHQH